MEQVVILADGRPIKTDSNFSNLIFDIDGYLMEFAFINKNYKYYTERDFKSRDLEIKGLNGYFEESQYLQYIQYVRGVPTAAELKSANKFNFDKYLVVANDSVDIKFVDFGQPYNYYYKEKKCSFTIEVDPLINKIKNYRDIVTNKILLPSNAVITPINKNLNTTPRGYFYKKNLGDIINSWPISESLKEGFCRTVTLTAFRINDIYTKVFSVIVSQQSRVAINNVANDPIGDTFGLNDFEKMIFLIEKSWGYYYVPGSDLPHRQSFDSVLSNTPDEEEYVGYHEAVSSFYLNSYRIQNILADSYDYSKLKRLIYILPYSSLGLLPLSLRKNALKDLMLESITTAKEALVLRLIYSVTYEEANDFLDFLLERENGSTNFETLYFKMDDARLARYPFMILADTADNRMHFVTAIYDLWRYSKYPFYLSTGDPNYQSYFLNEGMSKYSLENGKPKITVFEFGLVDTYSAQDPIPNLTVFRTTWSNYRCVNGFKGEIIPVERDLKARKYYESDAGSKFDSVKIAEETIKTDYHIYFPITIVGHKTEGVEIPEDTGIPVFLFFYTQDFKKLQKIDAAINLGIQIGLEAVIFFTLGGGLTTLKNLKHLRELLNIRKAIEGGIAANETVLIWTGLTATTETYSIRASVLSSLASYNATILPEGPMRDQQIEASKSYLYLALGSGLLSGGLKFKAINSADNVLSSIEGGVITNIPADVLEVLTHIRGQRVTAVAQLQGSLTEYENISFRLASFSPETKAAFWSDFSTIDNSNFWARLDANPQYMENWYDLHLTGVGERTSIDFVTDTKRVSTIMNFYSEIELRKAIEPLQYDLKVRFLDDFGDIDNITFQRLKTNPKTIEKWELFSGEKKLFAKNNPLIWVEEEIVNLRFEKLYVRPNSLPPKITFSQVLEKYGENPTILYNSVEDEVVELRSGSIISQKVLVSGMIDKSTGEISDLFTNFINIELADGTYLNYLENLHPNMRIRFDQSNLKRTLDMYTLDNYGDMVYTGEYMAAHAEVRALNDLAIKKFGMATIETRVFDDWLKNNVVGYNSYIRKDGIMPTCVDCFYLTDLVTFIK